MKTILRVGAILFVCIVLGFIIYAIAQPMSSAASFSSANNGAMLRGRAGVGAPDAAGSAGQELGYSGQVPGSEGRGANHSHGGGGITVVLQVLGKFFLTFLIVAASHFVIQAIVRRKRKIRA